jgi:hypothetical protein
MADGTAQTLTPYQIDAEIRRVYSGPLKYGDIAKAARRLGLTSQSIYERAQRLGLAPAYVRGKAWSADELLLLEETTHMSVAEAKRRFNRAGYVRSERAITSERSRRALLVREARAGAGLWTTEELSALLGVDSAVINRWVTLYGLKAERRGTDAWARLLIAEKDLRQWIPSNAYRIHPGRIPHASWLWFVTMLSGL